MRVNPDPHPDHPPASGASDLSARARGHRGHDAPREPDPLCASAALRETTGPEQSRPPRRCNSVQITITRVTSIVAALLLPAFALAGGEARILADVLLDDQPEAYEGGSLIGPPDSRATWFSFGGIEPFGGVAMVAFSTGEAGGEPLPGTDLGAVGADNDIAGLNLTLRAPDDAHSLRIAVRALAPEDPGDGSVGDDVARILVAGDAVALDPATLGDLVPESVVFATARDEELAGTPYDDGGTGTGWIEAMTAVEPGAQVALRIEVRDGADDAFGDLLLLVDALRFDAGVIEGVDPGPAPLLTAVTPAVVPEDAEATVRLSGRTFPADVAVELVDGEGLVVHAVAPGELLRRSAEQLEVTLPPLPAEPLGVRMRWSGGALRWDDVLRIETERPLITGIVPDVGPADGGGLATVTGSGFHGVTSVTLGGADVASFEVLSPERIDLVVPPGDPGPDDLELFAAGGFVELVDAYTWAGPAGGVGDDDDDGGGGGPAPIGCGFANSGDGSGGGGGSGGAGLLAGLAAAAVVNRRRSGGPRPASA